MTTSPNEPLPVYYEDSNNETVVTWSAVSLFLEGSHNCNLSSRAWGRLENIFHHFVLEPDQSLSDILSLMNRTLHTLFCSEPDSSFNTESIYISFLTLVLIFGLVGNCLQLFLVSHDSLRGLSFSVYLRHLAVVDSINLMHTVAKDYLDHFYNVDNVLGYSLHLCRFWNCMTFFSRHLSPWLLVALTVERFIAVAFPFQRQTLCTYKNALVVSAIQAFIFLLMPLIFVAPQLEIISEYRPLEDVVWDACFLKEGTWSTRFLQVDIVFVMTFLPCMLILLFNVGIAIKLQSAHKSRQKLKGDVRAKNNSAVPASAISAPCSSSSPDKTIVSLMAVSTMAFITLTPKAVVEAYEYFTEEPINKTIWMTCNSIELTNFAFNFYVLMITGKNYKAIMRTELSKLFQKIKV